MFLKDNFNLADKLTPKVDENPPSQMDEDWSTLSGLITTRYNKAKLARQQEQETIWLNSYRAWRGELSPEESASISAAKQRMGAASSVFIKITKTKTTAAYGQLCEILFANNKYPLGVEPTPRPEGIEETVTILPEGVQYGEEITDKYGYSGDGREIPAGATATTLVQNLKSSFTSLLKGKKLVKGASPDTAQFPQIHPAQIAATNLEKVMHDQLEEGGGERLLRKAALECVMYGTGIKKGPFTTVKVEPNWTLEEENEITYNPALKKVPEFSHVSIWDYYPDPDARNHQECEYEVERHLMSKSQLRQLLNQPNFFKEAILEVMAENPTRSMETWESILTTAADSVHVSRYEVLEYWGTADKEMVEALGIEVKDTSLNVVQVNAWICNGKILRLVLNPFQPTRSPYHIVTYEEHPHRVWGIGVPENMADTQMLMNGHMRMSIDNLRFAGSLVFEVNENQLVPGQDFSIFPGKVFRKQGGAPGQSLFGLTFPNTAPSHIQMFDKVRALADEATGLPSYMNGQTGAQSGIRSASQTSMLMSAAALNIKTVAKNFDEFLTSVGNALFYWNMQFNTIDKDIRGDVKIVAKGTASLMQREVITQRLLSLLQIMSNPIVAPFGKVDAVLKEIVRNMDLDPEKFVNDPATAKMFAEILQAGGSLAGAQAGQQPSQEGTPSPTPSTAPPAAAAGDNTGQAPAPQPPMAM
jgi:hypothetical protein